MSELPPAATQERKRSIVRDLLTAMSGTAGAQLIGLLILPILARNFAPEAFGIFQLYLSLVIFCAVGIALRIELTLLSKPDEQTSYIVAALCRLVLIISALLTLLLLLYGAIGPGLGFPPVLFGLGIAATGLAQVASYKLVRDQNFQRLAVVKISQVFVYAVIALAIAWTNPTLLGLIIADVAGRLAAGAVGLASMRGGSDGVADAVRIRDLFPFVRANWELAVISLPGALANAGGAMLTPFMIFHVFGVAAAGQYGLVDRSMGVPVAMLISVGSQVFAGRINEQLRSGKQAEVLHMLTRLAVAGILVCGVGATIVYWAIPQGFSLAFGAGWGQAAAIARILIFAYAVSMVAGVMNVTLVSLNAYKWQAAWDLAWPLCIGGAWIAVTVLGLDLYTAVMLHALSTASLGVVFILLCIMRLRRREVLVDGKGV